MNGRIVYYSPVGTLEITSDGDHLIGVRKISKVAGTFSRDTITDMTVSQLKEYFNGERKVFDVPLAPQGTAFQRSVWSKLAELPFGETRSYGDIAAAIGKPSASRAAGNAVGSNPILIIIPCHRIIRSDGALGGFSAGLEMKKYLLRLEHII